MSRPFTVKPAQKAVKTYYEALAKYAEQGVDHEGAARPARLSPTFDEVYGPYRHSASERRDMRTANRFRSTSFVYHEEQLRPGIPPFSDSAVAANRQDL